MNDLHDLHEGLERLSHHAPQIDAARLARTAASLADRRRRGYAMAVPGAAIAATAIVVAAGAALQPGAARPGTIDPLADPSPSLVATPSPSSVPGAAAASAGDASAGAPTAVTFRPGGQTSSAGQPALAYGGIGAWTCCDDADRAEQVKAGGSFVAHFRSIGAAVPGPAVTVTVALTGPFADAKAMMSDPHIPADARYTSVPLTLPIRASGVQTATVSIPATAEPGLYLISLVQGGSEGSAGTVRITS